MVRYRREVDFLGSVKVPYDAYYGSETQRTLNNFNISGIKVRPELITALAIIKRSAALANTKEGKLDKRISKAIVRACDEILKGKLSDQFIMDIFQSGAGTSTNMNVNEVVANRASEILGGKKGTYKIVHPNDHVNMSQSTNDTYHAAIHIATYFMINDRLIPAVSALEKALKKKAAEFKDDIKTGRTHLQDAVPITLGQEFSGYAYSVGLHERNLADASKVLLHLSLGGTAIGTGIETKKEYHRDVVKEINSYTKGHFVSASNFFGVQQNQNEELIASNAIRELAIALSKIANDLRLLNSGPAAGFSDIVLPAMLPGSSIMPGKVNPSIAELLNMVCFQVIGNDLTVSEAAEGGQLELNVFMPVIAYNLLYSIEILSRAINTFTDKCVKGIKSNSERMRHVVNKDMSLATALAPYIGYAKAAKIARKAYKEDKTVMQVCLEMKIMPKEKLKKILDPKRLVKP